ncbi:DNA cytosine methyltransferase [Microcoleus sp. Pol11C2]|uniref:DNA cytosine methyltransferase n=1 Tax=Microcoleus sp. Pol11C2 TaxID=3055389 RepID=UPI002FD514AB
MFSVVSLFSGCGGLDIGFKELGFELIYACDSDAAAVDCYSRNVDQNVFLRDVTSSDFHEDIKQLGHCDVVLGGFPCQGFSKAGPKNENDTRNTLYTQMWRAVNKLRPAIFIAENVDGINQNFKGNYLKCIIEDFKQIGYRVEYRTLDTVWFGVAQHRRRTFFVGVPEEAENTFRFPSPTYEIKARNGEYKLFNELNDDEISSRQLKPVLTIKDAISDLLELDSKVPDHKITTNWPKTYKFIFKSIKQGQKLCNVRHSSSSVYTWEIPEFFGEVTERERIILENIGKHRRHKKYGAIPNGNPIPTKEIEMLSQLTDIELELKSLMSKGYLKQKDGKYDLKGAMFCSGLFKKPFWNEPSPTILTNFYNPRYFLHPLKDRPFSLRECARLQGFPDIFIFTEGSSQLDLVSGYRLVGNAVPPPISKLFAKATLDYIRSSSKNLSILQKDPSTSLFQTLMYPTMKVPTIALDLETQLKEFDVWITPSLGEIQDSGRFQLVMNNVVEIFESLATATSNFNQLDSCQAIAIANTFIELIQNKNEQEAQKYLEALATVLFLVTGKSDNNSKCQLPLYLRDEAGWESLPAIRRSQGKSLVYHKKIPRVLKADAYMKNVADLSVNKNLQQQLLQEFVKFILKDESCVSQLWSIGHSYIILKQFQKERDLLAPLIIFQVRGSVSASGGHKPEMLLRERFTEWGLQEGIDFNKTDVIVEPEATKIAIKETEQLEPEQELLDPTDAKPEELGEVKKTRAYDFVLPFKTFSWKPRIFVQCQFYAGDSGSVSHKNIDQTETSRNYVRGFIPDARFIEYVDGAGYFSSLNGDLKKLLSKPTTTSFFQVRSAAVRLRRELQEIGFLVPLSLEQAIARSDGDKDHTKQILQNSGYSDLEINRCLQTSLERNLIFEVNGNLLLQEDRRFLVRRYFLLDVIAQYGKPAKSKKELVGSIIIPGYGPFYGIKLTNLVGEAFQLAPGFRNDWSNPQVIMEDINWLCEERLAMLC